MTDKDLVKRVVSLSELTSSALKEFLEIAWETGLDGYADVICALKQEHDDLVAQLKDPTSPGFDVLEAQDTGIWRKGEFDGID